MTLLSMKDGWILGQKKPANESRRFSLVDRNFKEHKQKILSSLNIENIAVFNDSLKGQSLAVYQKKIDVQMSTISKQKLILNLYEMREDISMKYIRSK